MEEIWKDVVGLEGQYEVSSVGRVRSVDRYVKSTSRSGNEYEKFVPGKIISKSLISKGYEHVFIKGNKYVHRLVGEAFIPNPENKPEIHHINHIRNDNRVENLMWVEKIEQFDEHHNKTLSKAKKGMTSTFKGKHFTKEQKEKISRLRIEKGVAKGVKNPRATPVDQYDIHGNFIESYDYIGQARELIGGGDIGRVCRGQRLQAGGYVWRFKGEPFNKYRTPKRIKLR